MLNRIRMSQQTKDDLQALKKRVRKKGHQDLKDALFITAKKAPVAKYNEKLVSKLPGKLHICRATHIQQYHASYKPKIDQLTGRIGDTQYVDALKIKIGARVMLIFNIDVSDLLCNGATGTVIGIEETQKGNISGVIVKFDNPAAGKESQKRNLVTTRKYPEGTLIKRKEQDYSLAKNKGLVSSTAKLIQFPLVLAWAVTVHKFQGQTVKQPQKVVIDLRTIFEPAQAYVMLSRVQEIDQLFILEELLPDKIYANHTALQEIERLAGVSKNKNPTEWEDDDTSRIRVSFLNCRSLINKFENIKVDQSLLRSDLIVLTETWLEEDQNCDGYDLPKFSSNFNNGGRGKGITSYFNEKFKHTTDIKKTGFSISMMKSDDLDVIGIYRSQDGNMDEILQILDKLIIKTKPTMIGGDLNVCVLKAPNNIMTKNLKERGFLQVVKKATHIDGGLLDHVYIFENGRFTWAVEEFPKYYSDHDGIGVTLWKKNDQGC